MLDPDVREVFEDVRELLSDESRWTKGFDARNASGIQVNAMDAGAVAWCLRGATIRAMVLRGMGNGIDERNRMLRVLVLKLGELYPGCCLIGIFNDSQDHEAVLALVDKVLADEMVA